MSVDYPRAWELIGDTDPKDHHIDCSYQWGILCDCNVLMQHPEVTDDILHTLGGNTIEKSWSKENDS